MEKPTDGSNFEALVSSEEKAVVAASARKLSVTRH